MTAITWFLLGAEYGASIAHAFGFMAYGAAILTTILKTRMSNPWITAFLGCVLFSIATWFDDVDPRKIYILNYMMWIGLIVWAFIKAHRKA